jgi:hypothetical protein
MQRGRIRIGGFSALGVPALIWENEPFK